MVSGRFGLVFNVFLGGCDWFGVGCGSVWDHFGISLRSNRLGSVSLSSETLWLVVCQLEVGVGSVWGPFDIDSVSMLTFGQVRGKFGGLSLDQL